MEYESWDQAFRDGHRLLIRSPIYSKSVDIEEDMQRTRIIAKALLVGIDVDWIRDMLIIDAFAWIETEVNRRCH